MFSRVINGYLDPAAFTRAPEAPNGTSLADQDFGNSGVGFVRGPGQHNFDFAVERVFPIAETHSVHFRTEFFNLTNTPQFANPVATRLATAIPPAQPRRQPLFRTHHRHGHRSAHRSVRAQIPVLKTRRRHPRPPSPGEHAENDVDPSADRRSVRPIAAPAFDQYPSDVPETPLRRDFLSSGISRSRSAPTPRRCFGQSELKWGMFDETIRRRRPSSPKSSSSTATKPSALPFPSTASSMT